GWPDQTRVIKVSKNEEYQRTGDGVQEGALGLHENCQNTTVSQDFKRSDVVCTSSLPMLLNPKDISYTPPPSLTKMNDGHVAQRGKSIVLDQPYKPVWVRYQPPS